MAERVGEEPVEGAFVDREWLGAGGGPRRGASGRAGGDAEAVAGPERAQQALDAGVGMLFEDVDAAGTHEVVGLGPFP